MWSCFQIHALNQFFSSFQLRWAWIGWFPGNERNHIDTDSSPGWALSGFREKNKHIKYRLGDALWKHSSLLCDSQTDPKSMPPSLLPPPHLLDFLRWGGTAQQNYRSVSWNMDTSAGARSWGRKKESWNSGNPELSRSREGMSPHLTMEMCMKKSQN